MSNRWIIDQYGNAVKSDLLNTIKWRDLDDGHFLVLAQTADENIVLRYTVGTREEAKSYIADLVNKLNGTTGKKKVVETDYGQQVSAELIDTFYVAKTRQEKISVFAKTVKDTSFIVADFNTWSEAMDHMNKLVVQLRGGD